MARLSKLGMRNEELGIKSKEQVAMSKGRGNQPPTA